MKRLFGSNDLCKCLEKLGFIYKRTSSSHAVYDIPKGKKVPKDQYPVMVIQLGKKQFCQHSCSRYISELKSKGFTEDEIKKHLF